MSSLADVHGALKEIDPSLLLRPELCGLISDLERLRCRVDERLMAAKAALDSLGDDGADSAMTGRSLGRRSERQAQRDRITARGLADMPALAGSLAEGRVNVEHAAILAAAALLWWRKRLPQKAPAIAEDRSPPAIELSTAKPAKPATVGGSKTAAPPERAAVRLGDARTAEQPARSPREAQPTPAAADRPRCRRL